MMDLKMIMLVRLEPKLIYEK